MKIMDKNLRLFGKLHILDLFALLLVCFVVFSVFFVRPKKPTLVNEVRTNCPSNASDTWLEVYVRFTLVIPEITDMIKPGDKDVALNGVVTAKVDKIIKIEDCSFDDQRDVMLKRGVIRFLVRVFESDGSYFAENYEIKAGKVFHFTTSTYDLGSGYRFEIIKLGNVIKGLKE